MQSQCKLANKGNDGYVYNLFVDENCAEIPTCMFHCVVFIEKALCSLTGRLVVSTSNAVHTLSLLLLALLIH